MSIQTSFSIKDLENLSGIKAHTIRIWEKRYNLLVPNRSDTNIRTYDVENLQKLLNVSLLNTNGFKVSKIAALDSDGIRKKVRETIANNKDPLHAINTFKIAMLNFDQPLFDHTFNKLLSQHSFREIFLEVFIALLDEIGVLWSTNTITPAHERFISTLIKQKLLINIERVQSADESAKEVFVLFLPLNEIHELGLLFLHLELLLKGHRSIYLGPSIPISNLVDLQKIFDSITYISYFTIQPSFDGLDDYLSQFSKEVLVSRNEKLYVTGNKIRAVSLNEEWSNVIPCRDLSALSDKLE